MNICLITDKRETYAQGNYYQCYINGFRNIPACTIKYLEDDIKHIDEYELLVIGHGAAAQFKSGLYDNVLKLLQDSKKYKIMFTRNDYGPTLTAQQNIIDRIKVDLTVVNTKQSLSYYQNTRVVWFPFGIDDRFINRNEPRTIDVGFRGNAHLKWIGDKRKSFLNLLNENLNEFKTDIVVSSDGEHFLQGNKYITWLNSCSLVANTVSASNTVGPKFIEAMACGCGIIAPPDDYEGLFKEDINYISIKTSKDIEKIRRYLTDESYRNKMIEENNKFVKFNSTTNQILRLMETI